MLAPLLVTIGVSYGAHLAAIFYALIVVRQVFAAKIISPGWNQPAAAVLAVHRVRRGRRRTHVGQPARVRSDARCRHGTPDGDGGSRTDVLRAGVPRIALVHYSFGRRGRPVGAPVFALTVLASVALPIVARGPGTPSPLESQRFDFDLDLGHRQVGVSPRVAIILIDGGSLDFVSAATIEGRLPNFGKILDSGAAMHLATLRPTQPEPVWTTVATGKLPAKTGIRSSARYQVRRSASRSSCCRTTASARALVRFRARGRDPAHVDRCRTRTFWSILGGASVPVGIVGWPLTYPAQPVRASWCR